MNSGGFHVAMSLSSARLRLMALCIGIVTTMTLFWWLAGPDSTQTRNASIQREGDVPRPVAAANVLSDRLPENSPDWEALEKLPPPPLALNPFEERLLEKAVLLDTRRLPPNGREPARQVKLWRTAFKHPLIREEVWLRKDAQGRDLPVRREFSVADHAMVRFPEHVTAEEIRNWTRQNGLHVRQHLKTAPVYLVAAENGTLSTADWIMSRFRQSFPEAARQQGTAERDYLVFPTVFPNDTSFPQLWGLHNTGQSSGTPDADIDAPEAWNITTGSRDILVGIIDTGVDRNHPDLAANMWTNPDEVPGNGVDDDGNGFVDDLSGWDFYAGDNNPSDEQGHGTHCAGTIGAVGNNVTGVAGVCWQVSMVGIRFLGPYGGSTSDAIESVNYATELGVDLTSNSWGGGGFSSLLQTAIVNAGAADQLFIAAAGNDGSNTDLNPNYPSGYSVNTIVSVASSTSTDIRSSFSNYGASSVDLAAPGSLIYSTTPSASYATYSGTSMATPHVAGAAALLKSIAPDTSAAEIKTRLMDTVDLVSDFAATTASRGRLNLARLIEESAGPRPVITVTTIEEDGGNGDGINNPGEALALRFTVVNRGNEPAENLTARLSSLSASSKFTITEGLVSLGTLSSRQTLVSAAPFRVQSQGNLTTPYAEEFVITLTHGSSQESSEHRVSLYLHTSARLEGRVTDAGTGGPLPGAIVKIRGSSNFLTSSREDGSYDIIVTDGVYQITATAAGYVTSAPLQVSTPPGRSGLDFALGIPALTLAPTAVTQTVYSGRTSSRSIEMRNPGSVPLVWSLELVNGQQQASPASLPEGLPPAESPAYRQAPDTAASAGFKSQEMRVLPAVNHPLTALQGARIGEVATNWDRSVLIADLEARGAQVVTLSLPLTEAQLDDINAIIVDDAIASFSESDITILRDRIASGTGLLCEADNATSLMRINQVLSGTGISANSSGTFFDGIFTDIRPHPMTEGVSSLREVAVGAYAVVGNNAQTLVGDPNGHAHAVVSRLGGGTVVYVGNEITDSSNYSDGDARLFANQIITGLVGRPSWLSAGTSAGVIQPGGAINLMLQLNSGDLNSGLYQASVIFNTNIPDQPEVRLPVTMNVIDAPQIQVEPSVLDFGSVVQGVAAQQMLRVHNIGRGSLALNSIELNGADAAEFELASAAPMIISSGGFSDIPVTLKLNAPLRSLTAEVVVSSDDPLLPLVRVPVRGIRQLPPDVASSPKSLLLQLRQGQTGGTSLTLDNKGKGPLSWQASLGSPGASPTWASLPGIRGTLQPASRGQVRVNFDTGVLAPGDYVSTLQVTTNDVDTPAFSVPVTLRVIAAPRPVMPRSLNAPDTVVGATQLLSVPVQNKGAATLELRPPLTLGTSFRCVSRMPFFVSSGSTRNLLIEFRPTRAATVSASMSFLTNVPSTLLNLSLSGKGVLGGSLKLTPASLSVSTAPVPAAKRAIVISNTGHLPVTWSAALEGSDAFTLESPRSGVLNAGAATSLVVNLYPLQRAPGTYRARITLTNNTQKPLLQIPLTLTLTRSGYLTLDPNPVILSKIWTGTARESSVKLRNDGNAALDVLSLTTSNPRLSLLSPPSLPQRLQPGTELDLSLSVTSPAAGDFVDELQIGTSVASQKKAALQVRSNILTPPAIALTPVSLDETLDPGQVVTRGMNVANSGGDTLTWTATVRDPLGPAAQLPQVRSNLESSQAALNTLIFNSHALTEGTAGSGIADGGANMFDDGNRLSTGLGSSVVPYSETGVINHATVGATGSYFTRKHGALWVFAADLDGASRFTISGGLGADGAGAASGGSITRTVGGVTYRGFFKRVTGTPRPSVNHLVILVDRPGLAHEFASDTDSDHHEITGFSGRTRLYYLLFGLQNGATYADSSFGLLMDNFLRRVVHSGGTTHWINLGQSSGSIPGGSSFDLPLTLDTRLLPGGTYTASVRLLSNAPARPVVDVPVVLRVPTVARLITSPGALNYPPTLLNTSSSITLTLRNAGNLPLNLTSLSADDPAYTVSGINLPMLLSPEDTTTAVVRFTPTTTRSYPARIVISTDSTDMPETVVNLSGTGLRGASISVDPASITETIEPGSIFNQVITLSNSGDAALQWSAAPSSGMAGILSFTPAAGSVPEGESRQTTLRVTTTATTLPGTYSGYVRFTSNAPGQPILDVPVVITVPSRPRLVAIPSSVNFGDVFNGGASTTGVLLRNQGNALLLITNITSSHPAFSSLNSAPFAIGAGNSLYCILGFRPDGVGGFSGQIRFTAPGATPSEVTLNVSGNSLPPPQIAVQPGSLEATLEQGQNTSLPLTISNDGGATLTWQSKVADLSTPNGTLQDVLERLNDGHAAITNLIPDLYPFTEGTSGTYIQDGGNDMYDGGNYLNTSLGNGIAYSDNVVTTSTKLGTGGTYFTRKHPGLFVFAADLNGVSSFFTSGNLGADGLGTVSGTTLTRTWAGRTYTGFFKSVASTTDPSVNHLVILESRSGMTHTYSQDSNNDDHQITGLPSSARLYYLLFARADGRSVSDTLAGTIMEAFLQNIALSPASPWISISPATGNTTAGTSSSASVHLSSATLEPGVHTATARFISNAIINSTVEVPVRLTVTPPALRAAPTSISTTLLSDSQLTQTLTLTAADGASPPWTAAATVPWITLSKTSGSGTDSITLTLGPLTPGTYSGAVQITYNGTQISVPVDLEVRSGTFARLLTDYRSPSRVLGLIRGSSEPSLLVALDAANLSMQEVLKLPAGIADMDISTDGRRLYALSHSFKSITEVDLDSFSILRTQPTPASIPLNERCNLETGRSNRLYYNDAQTPQRLHVFDFDAAVNVYSLQLPGGASVGDFTLTPDGGSIYARSVNQGVVNLVRIDSSGDMLSQAATNNYGHLLVTEETPVFYSSSRDRVFTQEARFNPQFTTRQIYTGQSIIAASAYGQALVSKTRIFNAETGSVLQSLPWNVTVAAFTGAQDAVIYFNSSTQKLVRVPLNGVISLPSPAIEPEITPGAVLNGRPGSLTWTGSPLAASYDVFLSTSQSAVDAANNTSTGIYLGNTSGLSFPLNSITSQPGQTYYWRIDIRNHDGSTVKGPLWSFRLPEVLTTPTTVSLSGVAGGGLVDGRLTLNAASPASAWSLTENSSWLSLSASSGSGSGTVTVQVNPAALAAGTHSTQITLTSGADSLSIPVTFRALGQLNVVKLVADPVLSVVYGMHRDPSSGEGWILWIDPATAQIQHALYTGRDIVDFTVHRDENLIHVLSGTSTCIVQGFNRQTRQIISGWSTPGTPAAIHNGAVGRVVLRNNLGTLQMHHSVTGGLVGSSVSLPSTCVTATPADGIFILAAVQQATGITGLVRYTLGSNSITYSSTSYWSASYQPPLVLSADGTRAFYMGRVYDAATLAELRYLGTYSINACSFSGHMGWSFTHAISTQDGRTLGSLPFNTSILAATASFERLILYNTTTRTLHSIVPWEVSLSPSPLIYPTAPVGQTTTATLTIKNLTNLDLTYTVSTNHPAMTVPGLPVTVNAGQSAQISLALTPSGTGVLEGSVFLSSATAPEWNRTALFSAYAEVSPNQNVIRFDVNAPAPGTAPAVASYTESGFRFTTPTNIARVGANSSNRPDNGTAHIATMNGGQPLNIVRQDGETFRLVQVDLAEYSTVFPNFKTITWTGTKAGGQTVSTSFNLDGFIDGTGAGVDFQTFFFPSSFADLVSAQVTVDIYSLDNLIITTTGSAAALSVSEQEPATSRMEPVAVDLDADGRADFLSSTAPQWEKRADGVGVCTMHCRGSALATLSRLRVQASREAGVWSDLTQDLDYSWEKLGSADESGWRDVILRISCSTSETWNFRVLGSD